MGGGFLWNVSQELVFRVGKWVALFVVAIIAVCSRKAFSVEGKHSKDGELGDF